MSGRSTGSGIGVGRAKLSLVVPCKRGGTAEWGRPAPAMSRRNTVYLPTILQSLFHPHTLIFLFSKKNLCLRLLRSPLVSLCSSYIRTSPRSSLACPGGIQRLKKEFFFADGVLRLGCPALPVLLLHLRSLLLLLPLLRLKLLIFCNYHCSTEILSEVY